MASLNLEGIRNLIRNAPSYERIKERLRGAQQGSAEGDFPIFSVGLLEAARPSVIAALQEDWEGPILVVVGKPERARLMVDQVRTWSSRPDEVLEFHAPSSIFYDRASWDPGTVHARVRTLSALETSRGEGAVIVSPIWALMTKSAAPMAFRRATYIVRMGEVVPLYDLLEQFVAAGYEPAIVVQEPGTFCHRGGIVDVFPPNHSLPLRIEFFGDEIDSIRTFDPATQRSEGQIDEAMLAPATEALPEWGKAATASLKAMDLSHCRAETRQRMAEEREKVIKGEYFRGIEYYLPYLYPKSCTLLDFLPGNALVLLDDVIAVKSAVAKLEKQAVRLRGEMIEDGRLPANFAVPYLPWEAMETRLASKRAANLGYGMQKAPCDLGEAFASPPQYAGSLQNVLAGVAQLPKEGHRVVLVTRQAERISDLLREHNVFVLPKREVNTLASGTLTLVDGILAEGWHFAPQDLIVLTDAEIFGWTLLKTRRTPRHRGKATEPADILAQLEPGDYVVHIDHGIGHYHGMTQKTINDTRREYLEIEYAEGDRLYVPVYRADRVARYLGGRNRKPYVHRLGGATWSRVRAKAEMAVREMASELLALYAMREVTPGHAFPEDTVWQHELEMSFPYEETEDQLQALAEVKEDMEEPKPMDRLICGDVGYGKTEVALRAAFKAVMGGRQVAMLVPTTVLAQQHFHTFRRRLRAFPVVIEMLSRFRTPREQETILKDLSAGRVDIVVGTHRLLSKDVAFKDLGLVIIDEEQRFGVSHKAQLRQMRQEVDVLTLTATPIPRTLYMSLSGIRDMSLIDTPPEDRLAVRTYVTEYDEDMVRRAILRELDRGGQVYYVHNRVQDIERVATKLEHLVPEASLVMGHGQMPEEDLAQAMLGFAEGEHDILLCTTIIENGLDMPNVNTMIVERAGNFGLAQLYQLRGRIGRGIERGYAYLFYKPPLTDSARRRLQAIQEASELGAGFQVAMRDLEIRGAGEILGPEQHGHIAAIGFDLYTRLLRQAIEELRDSGEVPKEAVRRAQHKTMAKSLALDMGPPVDLPLSAHIPKTYIADEQLRLRMYQRLARMETVEDVQEAEAELRDRFGALPDPVRELLYILRVRLTAARAGVTSIRGDEEEITIVLPVPLMPSAGQGLLSQFSGLRYQGTRMWLSCRDGWETDLLRILHHLGDTECLSLSLAASEGV
ncbi:MAG: transcription-repair coupling factor [Chloroflexota bacterium]|nr:transcription-repair coupling factor [Chloroflexota bacterium]